MSRLALAIVLTAASGVTAAVVHKRPTQARPTPASVQSLPLDDVRASRAEHRLPLLLVKAPSKHSRQGAPRPVGSHPRPRRATPASSSGTALNWPALAQCESSGNPRTNTGNGFYGAYQFDLETWRSVGGHGLPSDNSLAEQTYRARLLYDQRGRQPWPVCGRFL